VIIGQYIVADELPHPNYIEGEQSPDEKAAIV
jgi:hypothetical protein